MSASVPPFLLRTPIPAASGLRPLTPRALAPILTMREAAPRRTRIWEFNTNLHCSIIGTCLSTGELRHLLRKLGMAPEGATDHELHGIAVTLAGRQDEAAKRLHKALDQIHKLLISQFGRAKTEADVRTLWREAVARGEIPGAYWATLTHEATGRDLIRDAFGEVHMLSHLVGSANRADIRRLKVLEAERDDLKEQLRQQDQALHDAIASRDGQINALRQQLATQAICQDHHPNDALVADLRSSIRDLQERLAGERQRRTTVEERLAAEQAAAEADRVARRAADQDAQAMRRELEAVEASLLLTFTGAAPREAPDLHGLTVLYVGGRPNQVTAIRAAVARLGGTLLAHDGGVENQIALLAGLISRTDVVMFPVDCVSHEAAGAVKTLCRQADKPFVPLRSSGLSSLIAALAVWDSGSRG